MGALLDKIKRFVGLEDPPSVAMLTPEEFEWALHQFRASEQYMYPNGSNGEFGPLDCPEFIR